MEDKMKIWKRVLTSSMAAVMTIASVACSNATDKGEDTTGQTSASQINVEQSAEPAAATSEKPEGDRYIELALNVYYNDGDSGYFSNESGESIYVTEEGQYTLSFDCSKDLSVEAAAAGVNSLTNLTAIYILDMGAADGNQSPLQSCNIMYDEVMVDGTTLTVTQSEPKPAFKSSGIFDTNDPINAWDGSSVEEVSSTSDHVANFTTLDHPTTISVTFTLSDMNWDGQAASEASVTSANTYVNTAVFSNLDFESMDALTLTHYLGNGINLGNTMEACNRTVLGPNASVSTYETCWGQPVTTAEMFTAMKNCGFDTVRIPVAWTNMMDYENGDYTIDPALLDRVEEIVGYALDAEMFVIVNDHWDGGWWGMFGSATPETVDRAWDVYEAIWTQVSERFKDYPDMLIFESANEELGNSLNSNTLCPDSGTLSEDECYALTHDINQKFVDIVRNSGGNNDDRFLLIAGYNTDIDKTTDSRYVMPADTAEGKLFISVHYYTPWNYCGAEKDSRWGLVSEYETMNELLGKMTRFTDAGYGVIFGEYAALPIYDSGSGSSSLKQNTVEFTANFLDNCDIYNYCPMLWSCNDYFNKTELTMITKDILNLFTSRCYAEESAKGDAYLPSVEEHMQAAMDGAPEMWEGVETYEPGTPVAWIMWNGGAGTYSVGDTYNPADNTAGIIAHDVVVDGEGTYTVSLDFEGGNNGLTFAALALADGELLYPGCILDIKEITVDGEPLKLSAMAYTSSDDGKCTRVNLYNAWVNQIPDDARNLAGNLSFSSPEIVNPADLVDIYNITITFDLVIR